MTKILRKFTSETLFLYFFGLKIAIYLSLNLHKGQAAGEAFSPQKRTLPNMKILDLFYICGSFSPSSILDPDPDPATQINEDPQP
jgi:hypothetical protein